MDSMNYSVRDRAYSNRISDSEVLLKRKESYKCDNYDKNNFSFMLIEFIKNYWKINKK
jgi:hypothetical protein